MKDEIKEENQQQKESRYVVYTMDDIKKNIYSDDYDDEDDKKKDEENNVPSFEESIEGLIKAIVCLVLTASRLIALGVWAVCSFKLNNPVILCFWGLLGYYYWIVDVPINALSGTSLKGKKKFLRPELLVFAFSVFVIIYKLIII